MAIIDNLFFSLFVLFVLEYLFRIFPHSAMSIFMNPPTIFLHNKIMTSTKASLRQGIADHHLTNYALRIHRNLLIFNLNSAFSSHKQYGVDLLVSLFTRDF